MNITAITGIPGSDKCIHCGKEGNLNDEKLCRICRKSLKRNPNHICRHKKHEKFVCKCGSTEFFCKDMCKLCYNRSPGRNTPERKAKDKARHELKKDEYNRNRGEKRNPNYQSRPDRSDFVCECGSTKYHTGGYCKKCAHRELGYGQKYENSHVKERKIQRLNNPHWQKNAHENHAKKLRDWWGISNKEFTKRKKICQKDCLIRDNFTCQACGYKKHLEVHHIFPKVKYPGLCFDLGNLIALCKKCHNAITYKKSQQRQNGLAKKESENNWRSSQ